MWEIKYNPEAIVELSSFDKGIRLQVLKGIEKVSQNPLPQSEGGYGKPLGNKSGNNLTGYFKIKYKKINIRVVYHIERDIQIMTIVVITERTDNECYEIASKRKK